MPERWRQGRHSGHNLYLQTGAEPSKDDRQIGAMFDPAHAAQAVAAVNARAGVPQLLGALDDLTADLGALHVEDIDSVEAWANNIQLDIMRWRRLQGGRRG